MAREIRERKKERGNDPRYSVKMTDEELRLAEGTVDEQGFRVIQSLMRSLPGAQMEDRGFDILIKHPDAPYRERIAAHHEKEKRRIYPHAGAATGNPAMQMAEEDGEPISSQDIERMLSGSAA